MDKPHYQGHRQRIRERFLKNGLDAFADYEAVELLLTLAIPRKDVKPIAKLALEKFKTFRGVIDAPIEELRQIPGLGEAGCIALKVIRETATRYLREKNKQDFSLANSQVLIDYCRSDMGMRQNEIFKVIYLDSGYRVLGDEILEEGTVDRTVVYPRRVMDAALRNHAAVLVLVHNHPSGDVTPSEHDKVLTRAIVMAAATLQIKVHDHLIVAQDKTFSFKDAGLL